MRNKLKNNSIQITDTSNLDNIKTQKYNIKTNEIEKKITDLDHAKSITTQEFSKLTSKDVNYVKQQFCSR